MTTAATNTPETFKAPKGKAPDSNVPAPKRSPSRTWIMGASVVIALGVAYGVGRGIVGGASQTTNDAYITADYTVVAPKVAGFIAQVLVQENQRVHAGELLARIDDRDYRTALAAATAGVDAAQAGLDNVNASLVRQQTLIAQATATVAAGRADATFARRQFERYTRLARQGAGTVQMAQQSRTKLDTTRARLAFDEASLAAAREQVSVLQAQRQHAAGELAQAQAARQQARLNLSYTRIVAPIDGVVGERALRLGAYVNPGMPLLAVVPVSHAYVIANFRETQLTAIRPSQHVHIAIDTFPGVSLRGTVNSIAPATGATFALIKPSNATGNFTKITQRIPVKIVFDAGQAELAALRAGMSVVATVDTDSGIRRHTASTRQIVHSSALAYSAHISEVTEK